MKENFYTILTDVGKAKIANSAGFGTKVNFDTFKIGDGGGSYYEPSERQTDLVNPMYAGKINDLKIDEENPNCLCVECVLPNNIGGFFIREFGIFDDEGDLIVIAKSPESYKPVIDDGSSKEMIIDAILAISNVDSVQLKIDKTLIFVVKEEFDNLSDEIYPDQELITINHGLQGYPRVDIIKTNYGAGIGGAGETPAGGTESYSVKNKVCYLDRNNIKIFVPKNYYLSSANLEKVNDNQYVITNNSIRSLLVNLNI